MATKPRIIPAGLGDPPLLSPQVGGVDPYVRPSLGVPRIPQFPDLDPLIQGLSRFSSLTRQAQQKKAENKALEVLRDDVELLEELNTKYKETVESLVQEGVDRDTANRRAHNLVIEQGLKRQASSPYFLQALEVGFARRESGKLRQRLANPELMRQISMLKDENGNAVPEPDLAGIVAEQEEGIIDSFAVSGSVFGQIEYDRLRENVVAEFMDRATLARANAAEAEGEEQMVNELIQGNPDVGYRGLSDIIFADTYGEAERQEIQNYVQYELIDNRTAGDVRSVLLKAGQAVVVEAITAKDYEGAQRAIHQLGLIEVGGVQLGEDLDNNGIIVLADLQSRLDKAVDDASSKRVNQRYNVQTETIRAAEGIARDIASEAAKTGDDPSAQLDEFFSKLEETQEILDITLGQPLPRDTRGYIADFIRGLKASEAQGEPKPITVPIANALKKMETDGVPLADRLDYLREEELAGNIDSTAYSTYVAEQADKEPFEKWRNQSVDYKRVVRDRVDRTEPDEDLRDDLQRQLFSDRIDAMTQTDDALRSVASGDPALHGPQFNQALRNRDLLEPLGVYEEKVDQFNERAKVAREGIERAIVDRDYTAAEQALGVAETILSPSAISRLRDDLRLEQYREGQELSSAPYSQAQSRLYSELIAIFQESRISPDKASLLAASARSDLEARILEINDSLKVVSPERRPAEMRSRVAVAESEVLDQFRKNNPELAKTVEITADKDPDDVDAIQRAFKLGDFGESIPFQSRQPGRFPSSLVPISSRYSDETHKIPDAFFAGEAGVAETTAAIAEALARDGFSADAGSSLLGQWIVPIEFVMGEAPLTVPGVSRETLEALLFDGVPLSARDLTDPSLSGRVFMINEAGAANLAKRLQERGIPARAVPVIATVRERDPEFNTEYKRRRAGFRFDIDLPYQSEELTYHPATTRFFATVAELDATMADTDRAREFFRRLGMPYKSDTDLRESVSVFSTVQRLLIRRHEKP